jgi:hypothetical protein
MIHAAFVSAEAAFGRSPSTAAMVVFMVMGIFLSGKRVSGFARGKFALRAR